MTVKLKVKVETDVETPAELAFTLTDGSDKEIAVVAENAEDGSVIISVKVDAGITDSGTYKLVVSKSGFTSHTITDIPLSATTAQLELGVVKLSIGDVDGNGQINTRDLNVILGGMTTKPAVMSPETGDLDMSGTINTRDLNYVMGNLGKRATTSSYTPI